MNCERFEELLFDRLDGRLERAEAEACDRHARRCARCADLRRMTGEEGTQPGPSAEAMVGRILAASGVDACAHARQLLAAREPAELAASDPLLAMHLEVCADCAAVGRVLEMLRVDLPALAELDPDAGFVDEVMRVTVDAPGWSRGWNDRWQRLLARPRLALEGAYVGTLIVALTFVTPAAAITEIPARVLHELRQDSAVRRSLAEGWQEIARTGTDGWERLAGEVQDYAATPPALAVARERIAAEWSAWRAELEHRWQQLRQWLIDPLIQRISALVGAAGAADEAMNETAPPEGDGGTRQ